MGSGHSASIMSLADPQEVYTSALRNRPESPRNLTGPTQRQANVQLQSANQPANIPLNDRPVEFTPGAQQDFMLRQEGLQQPAMVEAINNFKQLAAEQQQIIDNAISPAVREKAQKQLAAIQEHFQEGMDQWGIRSPQDATGLRRKLYDAPQETALPISKTFDPRRTSASLKALRSK